jgi:hypothetical protein
MFEKQNLNSPVKAFWATVPTYWQIVCTWMMFCDCKEEVCDCLNDLYPASTVFSVNQLQLKRTVQFYFVPSQEKAAEIYLSA